MKSFEKENQQKSIFPLNDDRFDCRALGNPQNKLCIFIKRSAYEKVLNHAEAHLSKEVGGILIGRYGDNKDMEFLEITDVIAATTGRGASNFFTFTHESWNQVYSEIDKRESNEVIVGWYHTHPKMGIFLSPDDEFIHTHFFTAPWQVALVVDPIRKEEGFFRYENNKKQKYQGFYIYEEKGNIENIYNLGKLMGRLEERSKHKGQKISLINQPLEHRDGKDIIPTSLLSIEGVGKNSMRLSPLYTKNGINLIQSLLIYLAVCVIGIIIICTLFNLGLSEFFWLIVMALCIVVVIWVINKFI